MVFLASIADLLDVLHDPLCPRESEEILLPLLVLLLPIGMSTFELLFDFCDLVVNLLNAILVGIVESRIRGFPNGIEVGKHAEVFVVSQRVVFVRVALGALRRDTENPFSDGVHAIE